MFNIKKRYFLPVIFLIPFSLFADTYSVNDKLYFGIGGGIISPTDVEIKTTTAQTANNVTFSANIDGEFEFDTGYQITGLVGYRLSDSLSFESEIGYSMFDYDKLNLRVGGTARSGGVTFTGGANSSHVVDGSISAFSMVFGPSFDFDFNRKVELFLGGGIGFASYNDEIKSVGNSTGLSYNEDYTDFAAKLKGGLNYSLDSKSFIQGDYGFNFVDSSIDNYTDDFTAHSFNAKFVINF
tara:strand:- start:95 stop:811 length:717 start_codon:yes stop_codon:yes gene_type:complete